MRVAFSHSELKTRQYVMRISLVFRYLEVRSSIVVLEADSWMWRSECLIEG